MIELHPTRFAYTCRQCRHSLCPSDLPCLQLLRQSASFWARWHWYSEVFALPARVLQPDCLRSANALLHIVRLSCPRGLLLIPTLAGIFSLYPHSISIQCFCMDCRLKLEQQFVFAWMVLNPSGYETGYIHRPLRHSSLHAAGPYVSITAFSANACHHFLFLML